jgi:predicted outer membrane protein
MRAAATLPHMSRLTRYLPVLGAAAVLGIGGAGANALATAGHHGVRAAGDEHAYSPFDEKWLQSSIEGDRFEIAGGKLAQEKGASEGIKAYGARLVADHTKSLQDAINLAQRLGIEVPKAPTQEQQAILELLSKFSGTRFDNAYADVEAADHQQDISEAKDEVQKGSNEDIRHEAANEIPTLQEHLKIAVQLNGDLVTDPLG